MNFVYDSFLFLCFFLLQSDILGILHNRVLFLVNADYRGQPDLTAPAPPPHSSASLLISQSGERKQQGFLTVWVLSVARFRGKSQS